MNHSKKPPNPNLEQELLSATSVLIALDLSGYSNAIAVLSIAVAIERGKPLRRGAGARARAANKKAQVQRARRRLQERGEKPTHAAVQRDLWEFEQQYEYADLKTIAKYNNDSLASKRDALSNGTGANPDLTPRGQRPTEAQLDLLREEIQSAMNALDAAGEEEYRHAIDVLADAFDAACDKIERPRAGAKGRAAKKRLLVGTIRRALRGEGIEPTNGNVFKRAQDMGSRADWKTIQKHNVDPPPEDPYAFWIPAWPLWPRKSALEEWGPISDARDSSESEEH